MERRWVEEAEGDKIRKDKGRTGEESRGKKKGDEGRGKRKGMERR